MLCELRLTNYRGFEDHVVPLRQFTILVGRNNAGKSTLVEALRFLSIVTARYRFLNYSPPPRWVPLAGGMRGVSPSLKGLEFSLEGLFHQYGAPPAIIVGRFEDGSSITVYLGAGEAIYAVLNRKDGTCIRDKSEAQETEFSLVATMPQVAPLARRELILGPEYVRSAADSYLAPLHFRNQLRYFREDVRRFKRLAEDSWHKLRIVGLETGNGLPGTELSLLVQDNDYVGEVASMGHGLQMWLQTMWFFGRSAADSTVVLDEPDVYMHADLQRRLVRLLRGRYSQVIVATHSLEILSEVGPEEICVVERTRPRSAFAPSLPAVQRVIEKLGSVQNIQLTRLWRARKCLMVEGKDVDFLAHFQNRLFPQTGEPLKSLPHLPFGGWGGWPQALGAGALLQNVMGESIAGLCVLDRDYHTQEEIEERRRKAKDAGLWLHVWDRKELENYLLVPAAIQRVIAGRAARRTRVPEADEIRQEMEALIVGLEDDVVDGVADEIQRRTKGMSPSTANRLARQRVRPLWAGPEGRLALVPGKRLLAALSEWSQREFGVGVSAVGVARELRRGEMPPELIEVMEVIEDPASAGSTPDGGGR